MVLFGPVFPSSPKVSAVVVVVIKRASLVFLNEAQMLFAA